jgi:hypothetical protein
VKSLKLRVNLSRREDRYQEQYPVTIFDGNIKQGEKKLPDCDDPYINFESQSRYTYSDESEGLVNTRFEYPLGGRYKKAPKKEGGHYAYARLSWGQRQILPFIAKASVFHRHPVASMALVANLIFGIINVVVGFINFQSSFNPDQTMTKQQVEILRQQSQLLQQQSEATRLFFEKLNTPTEADTTAKTTNPDSTGLSRP